MFIDQLIQFLEMCLTYKNLRIYDLQNKQNKEFPSDLSSTLAFYPASRYASDGFCSATRNYSNYIRCSQALAQSRPSTTATTLQPRPHPHPLLHPLLHPPAPAPALRHPQPTLELHPQAHPLLNPPSPISPSCASTSKVQSSCSTAQRLIINNHSLIASS
jgi:hypothetical protein